MELSRWRFFAELYTGGRFAALIASQSTAQTKGAISPGEARPANCAEPYFRTDSAQTKSFLSIPASLILPADLSIPARSASNLAIRQTKTS
jgi:hypothetical protein